MSPIGTGHCETFRGTGEFPHFPGSGLNQGDLVGPQAVWEAPGPLPPGLYLRAGAAGLEGITRLSHGEVCPSSGAEKTPPNQPGLGEPTKSLCSCPGTNGLEAARSAVSQRHQRPRGSGRGKGDRWRTDRWEAKQGSGETHACACQGLVAPAAPAGDQLPLPTPCQPHGCTSQPWRCSHSTLDTAPGPGSQLVPGSPGRDVRTPWDWHGPSALFAGDGKLEKQILQEASQVEEASMACRKRSCRILATSVHSHFVEFPVLLSCLLSRG